MLGYYVDLALRSLKRTPILTGLMVLALALGIGASMTTLTVTTISKAIAPWLDFWLACVWRY